LLGKNCVMAYDDDEKQTMEDIVQIGLENISDSIDEGFSNLQDTIRNVTLQLELIRKILDKQAGGVITADDFHG